MQYIASYGFRYGKSVFDVIFMIEVYLKPQIHSHYHYYYYHYYEYYHYGAFHYQKKYCGHFKFEYQCLKRRNTVNKGKVNGWIQIK